MKPANKDAGGIKLVLFDYGGVLAEEGFRNGLKAIANKHGQNPERFFAEAQDLIARCGYLTGQSSEAVFWDELRKSWNIDDSDEEMRAELFSRFILRGWMIELVSALRRMSLLTAVLSDQTNWLDELDKRDGFFGRFDRVFNSYHLHKTKHDPSVFADVTRAMGVLPEHTLFIDDSPGNAERARSRGLHVIMYQGRAQLECELGVYISGIRECKI